ncbi:hypothetical protein Bbelb_155960 [Branchiostoma belcheri]|nr:hypothetical protein Bbelb_155950 [Branchiostoma belcheri]KAI8507157.1 hypothetical protein Bbelb_155960 [Branchiostoma belcheri]
MEPLNTNSRSDARSRNSDDIPCTQTSDDAPQQGDEANNDDGHCLQPCAVASLQGEEAASIIIQEGNENNPCFQPHKHQEDEKHSPGPDDRDATRPCDVEYQEHDDIDTNLHANLGTTFKNSQTTSIASDEEDIKPYAVAYMYQDDMSCSTTTRDEHTSLPLQNPPTMVSNHINDNLENPSNSDVLNALNPNPQYVPNVQDRPVCVLTTHFKEYIIHVTRLTEVYRKTRENFFVLDQKF